METPVTDDFASLLRLVNALTNALAQYSPQHELVQLARQYQERSCAVQPTYLKTADLGAARESSAVDRVAFIPAGYSVVPDKPTAAMRSAAGATELHAVRARKTFFAGDAWEPMIHAAVPPQAPVTWAALLEKMTAVLQCLEPQNKQQELFPAEVPPAALVALQELKAAMP